MASVLSQYLQYERQIRVNTAVNRLRYNLQNKLNEIMQEKVFVFLILIFEASQMILTRVAKFLWPKREALIHLGAAHRIAYGRHIS